MTISNNRVCQFEVLAGYPKCRDYSSGDAEADVDVDSDVDVGPRDGDAVGVRAGFDVGPGDVEGWLVGVGVVAGVGVGVGVVEGTPVVAGTGRTNR